MGRKTLSSNGVSAVATWGVGPEVTITIESNPSNLSWRVRGRASDNDTTHYISQTRETSASFDAVNGKSYAFQTCPSGNWGGDDFFEPIFDHTFTINKSAGASITCSQANGSTIEHNGTFTITAGQTVGYNETTFTVSGATLISGNTYQATGNVAITANATVRHFYLTIEKDANSIIDIVRTKSPLQGASTNVSINDTTPIYYKDILQIFFSANTGYEIDQHIVDTTDYFISGNSYTVTNNVSIFAVSKVKSYNLILNADMGTEITVYRIDSPLQGEQNTSWFLHNESEPVVYENAIYYADVLEIEFGADAGYELTQHLVNQTVFTSGGNHEVTGEVEVVAISGLAGLINIYNGNAFDKHLVYIYNGSTWDQYIPYIYDGTDWLICS